MVVALFSFRGRLGRLAYLRWSAVALALVVAIGAAFLAAGAGLAALGFAGAGPTLLGVAMAATMMVVAVWCGLALASRRIRDTGYDPVVVIGLAMTAALFDAVVLTRLTETRLFWFPGQTPFGAIVSLGYYLFVVFWPSTTGALSPYRPVWFAAFARALAVVAGMAIPVAAAGAFLLLPNRLLETERHELSQAAMRHDLPLVAAAVLHPLAAAGDARALNNLGALYAHGEGVWKDVDKARRLLADAAAQGSPRARLNSAIVENGGCGIDARRSAASAAALQAVLRHDPVAPRLIQACLYFNATAATLPTRHEVMADSATRILELGDPDVLLDAGWAMLNLARTTKHPQQGNRAEMAAYDRIVIPAARKAMDLLFAAAEAGATAAYEPIGILSMQFGDVLGNDQRARLVRDKDRWEWIEEGAAKGDWAAGCRVADARMTSLRYNGRDYSREEFDAAVAMARACIDRKEAEAPVARWHDGPEWLAITPPRTMPRRPSLTIDATRGQLNGFLLFDADRQRARARR